MIWPPTPGKYLFHIRNYPRAAPSRTDYTKQEWSNSGAGIYPEFNPFRPGGAADRRGSSRVSFANLRPRKATGVLRADIIQSDEPRAEVLQGVVGNFVSMQI